MKKKIIRILILLIVSVSIIGCSKKREENALEENKTSNINQTVEIIEKNEDGTVKKGILEGYTFTETEKKTQRVKLEMENGDMMLIVLSNSDTPITIANFQKLVDEKFYDGLTFHRVMSGFMIQGGDPKGDGTGGSKEEIKGEFAYNGVTNNLVSVKSFWVNNLEKLNYIINLTFLNVFYYIMFKWIVYFWIYFMFIIINTFIRTII